jgi:hypothetical protein
MVKGLKVWEFEPAMDLIAYGKCGKVLFLL